MSQKRLHDAVSWSGTDVTLILFVGWESGHGPALPPAESGTAPGAYRTHPLEDLDHRLPDTELYEYDLVFDRLPTDLSTVVTAWLTAVRDGGSKVAWFAFEGSFDFEHLLTADIAPQVFGIADPSGVQLALEDDRRQSSEWVSVVERAGGVLRSS